jgi:5'(3')-deoxyribonucleotidase
MNIIVDVDDVLRDFAGAVLEQYNAIHNDNKTIDDLVQWEHDKCLPKMGNFYDFIMQYRKMVLYYAKPLPGATTVMNRLSEKNRLVIATHQFSSLEGLTLDWLKKNYIPHDAIFFGKDKYLLRGDVMIDDKYTNLLKFKRYNPGSMPVLMDKPWNQDPPAFFKDDDGITQYMRLVRVKDMNQAHEMINEHAKYKDSQKR